MKDQGVTETYIRIQCVTNPYFITWGLCSAVYRVVLHTAAIVLSVLTRKVEVTVLNDGKYTTTAVYISTCLIVALLLVVSLLGSYRNTSVSLVATFEFLDAMVFLSFAFIPKVSHTSKLSLANNKCMLLFAGYSIVQRP